MKKVKSVQIVLLVFVMISSFGIASVGQAEDGGITIKIDSLSNVRGNGAMEACGTATHKDGTKPLLVTIKHDESYYTTLTAPNDKWCAVVKRWTFSGNIEVGATTLQNPSEPKFQSFELPVLKE